MRIKQMRIQLSKLVLTAIFGFAMALTFSCSDDSGGSNGSGGNGGVGGNGGGTTPGTGSGGTFTITGIPAQYNGMYAYFAGSGGPETGANVNSTLWGGQDYSYTDLGSGNITYSYIFSPVSNGRASIPVWIRTFDFSAIDINAGTVTGSVMNIKKYSGSDTYTVTVVFVDVENANNLDDSHAKGAIQFQSVTFQNGSAAKSWNEGIAVNY
jgi:hypothetical protein